MSYRQLRSFRARIQRRTLLAATVASLLGLFSPAASAQLQWDAGLTPLTPSGGTGTWDTTTLNWSNGSSPNVAWDSLNAIFGGGTGTVTIDPLGVSATGLTFNTPAYTIAGGPLTLTGAAILNGTGDATISSIITGSPASVTKSGTNVITLSGVNTFFGNVSITGGGLVIAADTGLGNAVNSVTLDGGFLRATANTTSARNYFLGATGGTLDVTGANNLTISTAFDNAGVNTLNKTGTGTVTLGAASTRSGVTNINDGRIAVTNVGGLGTGVVNVTGAASVYEINTAATNSAQAVNVGTGGTFQWTQNAQLTLLAGNALSFTGTTGTINVGGTGSTGKVLAAAGLVNSASGSTVTKTGGGVLQLAGANTGWLGNVNINAGTIEFQNADSFGTAVKTVTISGTGDLATGNTANRNNIILAGGTLSANNAAANYTGSITAQAATTSTIGLRTFQATGTAQSFTISGPISGSGTLNVTAPAAATLTLSGNNSAFTGTLNFAANASTTFTARTQYGTTGTLGLTGGTVNMRFANTASPTLGTPGLNATYYNFGLNPNASTNPSQYAVDQLYVSPRTFSRTDANINMPNTAIGNAPIVPVSGYTVIAANSGLNDGVMWKGMLNITNPASYQFSATNDDNLILFIDGVQIGTMAVNAANTNLGAAVTLAAGAHSIVVKQSQGGGGGYTTLSYNGGAGSDAPATTLIPASAFTNGNLAPVDIGTTSVAGGTLDITVPTVTPAMTLGNGTFTVTSPTIDNLFVTAATINAATPTLAPTSGGLVFTGPIGQTGGTRALNIAGPYTTEFQAINTYDGLTTVSGGQLRLNATGGNSIAGGLTVNSTNANGAVVNVRLLQANQLADTGTLTMTAGILDLGAFNETVGGLALNGGAIIGSGVLTSSAAPTLTGGTIFAGLGGNFTLNKTGTGTAVLAGNGSYTGATTVSAGILQAQSINALGAGGAGNETTVTSGASLRTSGASMPTEAVTISGTGIAGDANEAALRNLAGVSQIGNLTTAAVSTVRVDSGELIVNGALSIAGGALTKTGAGTLTFATNQASIPAVTLTQGALGFSGTQSFGSVSVPANLAYSFNSNPLAGGGSASLLVGPTSTVIANYNADQAFLSVIAGGSTGTLALTGNNANNLDFSAAPGVSVGAVGLVNYSGTITPNAGGYRLGGGGGKLSVSTPLTGTNNLEINGDVQLNGNNTFVGTTTVKTGGRLITVNNQAFGAGTNGVTLDGGTLQLINTSDLTGGTGTWVSLGYPASSAGGTRAITIGAGGGTIDLPARQGQGSFAMAPAGTLNGSGTLTKTGLGFFAIMGSQNFSGPLVLAANSNRTDVRVGGSLANVASVTIETGARLDIDNNSTLGSTRLFAFADNRNRLNDAATIQLNGGTLRFVSRNVAFTAGSPATSQENVGETTLGVGQSFINATRTGAGGADLVISNLVRATGGGTVNFTTDNNTLGQFGDNPRIILSQVNGVAPTNSAFIGGWATINQSDFAAYGQNSTVGGVTATSTGVVNYGATGAPTYTALAATTTPGGGNFTTGTIGNMTASLALGQAGAGQDFVVRALRFGSGGTASTLTFAGTTGTADTLYVESGGIITDNGAGAKSIGVTTNAFTRGRLTAGTLTATTPQELFFHNNTASTLTINSQIIDNPNNAAATVKVVKAQDGTVTLDGTNLYTGGTLVARGTLTVNSTGGLGTGAVLVKNSQLNLATISASSAAPGTSAVYTTAEQSLIVLTGAGATVAYTGAGDRFNISSGSAIYANSGTANFGFNSLTRVDTPTSFTAGGQIYLAPGAIVKHNVTNAANQGTGNLTIKNLGTAADLFFAPVTANNTASFNQTITVGAGTPWAGLSSERSSLTWNGGTIFANSDFTLQGLTNNGALTSLTLGIRSDNGSTATKSGGVQIVNNTNGPINAMVVGQVIINEDEPVLMPSNLTFVLTPGSVFQPNTPSAMGFGSSQAKILVQAGAILDPGNYVGLGAAVNANRNPDGTLNAFQNLPYALPSPVNGQVTVEAGGKFLVNDTSGIGSAPLGSYTFKSDSVLELGSVNAFLGRGTYGLTQTGTPDTTGLALPGQFVFENGTVVRFATSNIYGSSQFIAPNTILEVFGGDRSFTGAINPFIPVAVGTSLQAPDSITVGAGGGVTNDNADRNLTESRGRILVDNGATISASSGTILSIQEGLNLLANANVNIGSTRYIDGMPKLGIVQLNGPNSNVAAAGATVTVVDGAQIAFGSNNVFPDNLPIVLSSAVTGGYPGTGGLAIQPSTGSSMLLNVANFMEYTGAVTGNGSVIGNQGGTALAMLVNTPATSNIVFKSTNGQNPSLMKSGTSTLTLTGNSDSTGFLVAQQGSVVITNGTGDWAELRPQRGASIVVDSSTNAATNRLGTPGFLVGQGGTFELRGHATTPTSELFTTLATGAGNFINVAQNAMQSTIKVTPGAATTTLTFNAFENYQATGQRLASYVINSPTVANAPASYNTASAIIPNIGNNNNGLVEIFAPNFGTNGAFGIGSGGVYGSGGSRIAATRPDLLGDADGNSVPEGFVTQDGVNYTVTNTAGTNLISGLPTTVGLAAGMPVIGTNIPANSRIATIVDGNSITITNPTVTAATTLNVVVGGLRNLSATEYSTSFRNHQTTGLNVKLSGTSSVSGDTRVQTLTLTPGTTLNIDGTLPLNGTSSRLILNSSGLFTQPGAASTINGSSSGGTETFIQTNTASSLYLHTWGDLNLNTKVFSDQGIVKTGPATLNVGAGAFTGFRGSFQIDGGTVNLGANNSFGNIRSQNGSTSNNNLYVNAGTLNLNGNSQMVNLLNSANELPGQGGIVTSATAARLTVVGGGRFAGTLDGAISLDKNANNTLLLTSAQTYTGTTTVRAGTLTLRDSAQLSPTAGLVSIQNATLQLDNGYLSSINNRINPATPVEMLGGTFNLTGGPGVVSQQTLNTVTLNGGQNTLSFNAGGSGAVELTIGNLVRTSGPSGTNAIVNFVPSYGNLGTVGTTTTAIHSFINNVNSAPLALTNNIIGGWAIVNGDHFATYQASVGVGAYGNTNDGFANYESTNILTSTATQNVNDGTSRTFAGPGVANAWRIAPNAASTMTLAGSITLTSGGLLTNNNNTTTFTGSGNLTSGTSELDVFVNQNTTTIGVPVTGSISLVKGGAGTLALTALNTYNGGTYVNGGTLTLGLATANGTTDVAVPGKLVINAATVTESTASQLSTSSDIVISGGGRFNLANVGGVTETIRSLTYLDGSSATALASGLDRTAAQATSTIILSAANAITSTNTNPTTGVPFIGGNTGILSFSNVAGATLNVTSPVSTNGVLAVGLRIDAQIGAVPTVAGGGLIKSGPGLLVLNPTSGTPATNFTGVTGGYDGTLGSLTDVFNITQGIVRYDAAGALGVNSANTTVQNGAVLLGSNTAVTLAGSIKLNDGATLGATISGITLGTTTTTVGSQSVLNVPSGNVTIAAYDYFVQSTNSGNVTINGRLTGAGTINLVGQQLTQLGGGGGAITLTNPILTGTGSNDFSGAFNIGTNSILVNQVAISGGPTRSTGNALGTATLNLNGGRLRIRDDATSGATAVSGTAVTYGNNVNLNANSYIDAGRVTAADTNGNNIIDFGTLNVAAGNKVLNVDSGTATTVNAGNGNYITRFSSLDGSGTLVKAGLGRLEFTAVAGTFTGGINIAGPQGLTVQPVWNNTGNVNLILPTGAAVPSFSVNGIYTTEAKTLNVTGAFSVNSNAGDIASNSSNNSGVLGLTNTATLNVGSFVNNGNVGSLGGTATINSTGSYTGSGYFLTNGQQLVLANGGVNGPLKFAGNNTVSLTGTTQNLSGVQVQSGTLRLAPTAATTSSGNLQVLASPAATVSLTSSPVAAVTATLLLDSTTNVVNHSGSITNSGLVRVQSGTTNVSGAISGTTVGYVPGLLEGTMNEPTGGVFPAFDTTAARVANPGNFGVRLEPRMFQTNVVTGSAVTGHYDNDTWVYTGYIKDDDGIFSLAQSVDDRAAIWVDGVLVLSAANGGTSRAVSTAYKDGQAGNGAITVGSNLGTPTQDFGPGTILPGLGGGWHLIEMRFDNGTGGAGGIAGNGFNANYGLGYKNGIGALDGADYIKPIDDGTGNLFVTPVGGKGSITVDKDATLSAGGFTLINTVTLSSATAGTGTFNVTANVIPAGNDADNLTVATGAGNIGQLNLAATTITTINTQTTVPTGTTLAVGVTSGTGGRLILPVSSALTLDGNMTITGSAPASGPTVIVNTAGAGAGTVTVSNGGVIGGSGSVAGPLFINAGGTVSPGNSPGILGAGDTTWATNGNYNWQMLDATGAAGTGFDQLNITGTLTVGSGFNFNLWSLSSTLPDVNGNANNFINTNTQYWVVAKTTAGGFTGTDLANVNLVTAAANGTGGFTNPLGTGSFSLIVGNSGVGVPGTPNDVVLKFTASMATGSPDLSVAVANPNLFVLQNASLTTSVATATLTNNTSNAGTVTTPAAYSNPVLTATTGQTFTGSGVITPNSVISLTSTSSTLTALNSTVTYSTSPVDANATDNVATVNVRIGNAPLHPTTSSTTFGSALIASTPINVTPYTNLSSNTIGETATGSTVPALGTTATIFNYTNSTGTDTGISMAWRSRTAAEASNIPSLNDNGTLHAGYLISDVVDLTGMQNTIGGFTDTFILQLSYSQALLDGYETDGVTRGKIFVASKVGNAWVNAVNLNSTNAAQYFPNQAYNASARVLGDYGVDPINNVVWAVLNHNSEFAVVPEPSTFVLGGLALLGFAGAGLRRRRTAKQQA